MSQRNTEFFPENLQEFVTSSFLYLDRDPIDNNKRLFFENAGGSLRLKSVVDIQTWLTSLPDCPVRNHNTALEIKKLIEEGERDIRLFLNAKNGSIATSLTASKLMFEMISTISSNSQSGNIVTTEIEHPSSYDACLFSAEQYNHTLRIAKADPLSGSIPIENIIDLIDDKTVLVSIVLTSNITGAMHDIKEYVRSIKQKNEQTIVVVDGVQGAPHGVIDVDEWGVDALNIAPYKMFGNRGVGFAYLSERISSLPHHRLQATNIDNWEVGSSVPSNYACFTKVIDYVCEIGAYFAKSKDRRKLIVEGMKQIHLQEQAILNRLINGSPRVNGIKDIPGVTIHFEEANSINQDLILALTFDNISSREAEQEYGDNSVLVFSREISSHYSKRILESVNIESIVRVSPLHCHNVDDVDRFLEVTRLITEKFK